MTSNTLIYDEYPYRLSGVVYGPLLNQGAALRRLGATVDQPPYKGAPKAPVLYMKPRNTLAWDGQVTTIPDGFDGMQVGATVGLVIGQTACRVPVENAMRYVAGIILVVDLTLPHDSFYRPSLPFVIRDRSCYLGSQITPLVNASDLNEVAIAVQCSDGRQAMAAMNDRVRQADQLVSDVTDFMTLSTGDILLMGTCVDMPLLQRGQTFVVSAPGLGQVQGAAQ